MVPAEVLNKPGKLTDEEWAMVRRHPTAGVELLADIEFPWDVRPIVESHHERWDGTGYPHGLAGEDIPLTARVLCIADVYDALTSQRSYKQRLHARRGDGHHARATSARSSTRRCSRCSRRSYERASGAGRPSLRRSS